MHKVYANTFHLQRSTFSKILPALSLVKTLFLFTLRDIPALVIPQTTFGITIALAGTVTLNTSQSYTEILQRIPLVVFWNWINVLLFSISNQRLPDSVLEDTVNKPWRPLPSRRITPAQARQLLLVVIPMALFTGALLGGVPEATLLMVLTWMYNDLGGADESPIIRNLLNALGITCYSSASAIIAAGGDRQNLNKDTQFWLGVVPGIIFTTLQIMDLADMAGDASRDRKTLPLIYGEGFTRWTIISFVLGWSVACPCVWDTGSIGHLICITMGAWLSLRTHFCRGVLQDKRNFKLWSLWTMTLYSLPLMRKFGL
ncbi:hypothetical protein P280DRAFT_486664 [Massarina eburnea CBS 473.64]|uniref:UbiA prenyltransferase n=1 Tax=Massarina eburnea CBS 473.64 TaxID=1395130 RepID=A0A6A6SCC7_9PLEO|nr:hypothetical protein P280DRAFT_486664 [Massarina eburnea CBS 473.64]